MASSTADVDSTSDHRARLVVVEHRLEEVTSAIRDLSHSFNKWVKDQASAPRPIPFKEIIVTAVASATFVTTALSFMDSRINTAIEIAKAKDIAQNAVNQYRLDEMYRKLNPHVQFVKPVQ